MFAKSGDRVVRRIRTTVMIVVTIAMVEVRKRESVWRRSKERRIETRPPSSITATLRHFRGVDRIEAMMRMRDDHDFGVKELI